MSTRLTGWRSSLSAAPVSPLVPDLAPVNPLYFVSPKNFEVEADDLVTISELGRGAYGVVEKVRHAQSGTIMAVKVSGAPSPGLSGPGAPGAAPASQPLTAALAPQRIRATVNSQEQKRLLMDLDVNMRTVDCFYTVTFYGALFREVGPRGAGPGAGAQPGPGRGRGDTPASPQAGSELAGGPGAWGCPRGCRTQPSQKAVSGRGGRWGAGGGRARLPGSELGRAMGRRGGGRRVWG